MVIMLFCAVVASLHAAESASPLPEDERIFELVERTGQRGFDDITYYVRMPSDWDGEKRRRDFRHQIIPSVRGVLALVSFSSEPEVVRDRIGENSSFGSLIRWADEQGLAVVTWTNMRGYTTGVSGDEMDEATRARFDRAFDERARRWAVGFRRLCRMYSLPEDNVLLYGISGGGQMAHRLALRMSEHFLAVHIHVNSSYDLPTRQGKDLLWLVTTGTLEYGYPAAQRFYQQSLDMGYHMIFKAEENLGHSDSPAIRRLSRQFFEYCLTFTPDARDPDWRPPPEDIFYFMRYPAYIGDWYNQMAFPAERATEYVPGEFMVSLPTRAVAEAWGTVIE